MDMLRATLSVAPFQKGRRTGQVQIPRENGARGRNRFVMECHKHCLVLGEEWELMMQGTNHKTVLNWGRAESVGLPSTLSAYLVGQLAWKLPSRLPSGARPSVPEMASTERVSSIPSCRGR